MAAAEPLEEPGSEPARRAEPVVPVEPPRLQGLSAQRESGTVVELPIRGSDAQLPEEVDRSAALATTAPVSEARGHVAQAPRRNPELLPHQSTLRSSRGDQRQHPHADQPRPRLQEHALPPTQSKAHGRNQHRIRRFSANQESRVECHSLRIPTESPTSYSCRSWIRLAATRTM